MTNTKHNPQGLRKGDLVRIKNVTEHVSYAKLYNIPTDTDLVVEDVSGQGVVRIVGVLHGGFASRFVKVEKKAPKARIKGVVVPTEDIMAVLTNYVKDHLGINAEVETVIEAFGESLQLVFAEKAA